MANLLLICIALLCSTCTPEPPTPSPSRPTPSPVSTPTLDINPTEIDFLVFAQENPIDGLVFKNEDKSHTHHSFKTSRTPLEKGFFIRENHEWKRHGHWFFFKNGILIKRITYNRGVKEGTETLYDSMGAILSSGNYVKGKKEYSFDRFDSTLKYSKQCFDYKGNDLTCCPLLQCGVAIYNYERKVFGPLKGEPKDGSTEGEKEEETPIVEKTKTSRSHMKNLIPTRRALFQNPETITIEQYHNSIKDGLKWSWENDDYKFIKTEKIFGLLKRHNTIWTRFGKWYFFKEGKISKTTTYLNDRKNGMEYIYHPSGFLAEQHSYQNDVRHGRSASYNSKGGLPKIDCYSEGKSVVCPPYVRCKPYKRHKKRKKLSITIEEQ